jgi:hypothetical protein
MLHIIKKLKYSLIKIYYANRYLEKILINKSKINININITSKININIFLNIN